MQECALLRSKIRRAAVFYTNILIRSHARADVFTCVCLIWSLFDSSSFDASICFELIRCGDLI